MKKSIPAMAANLLTWRFMPVLTCRALVVLIALLVALGAQAQDRAEPWPRQGQPPLVADPSVTWGKLPNGLRYAIMPNNTPPGRVSLRLLVEAGSLMESEDQRGLAHFLEHMAFKGSENVPPGEFVRYLQRQGMSFGADTNARTGFDSTVYQLELPGNTADLVGHGLYMLSEIAGRLSLLPTEIEPERGVILSEKRLRNTPGSRKTDALLAFMLGGTLYPERNPIGTDEVIQTADRADFERFYRDYYTPERTVVVVAGDVQPADVSALIEQHFAGLVQPADAPRDPDPGTLGATGTDALYFMDPGLPTTIALMHAQPDDLEPDSLERVDRRLVESIAHLMLSRRLQTLALTPGAAFTEAAAWTSSLPPVAKISGVTLQTTLERWEDALAVGEQELRRALSFGFSQQELDGAVGILRSRFEANLAGSATVASSSQVEAIVATIMDDGVFTSAQADMDLLKRTVADLTPQKALAALQGDWGTGQARLMLTGPFQLDDARTRILDAYRRSRAVEVQPRTETAVAAFAYTSFGMPSAVTERETIGDLGIASVAFGNGVRLDMKPTKLEADTIEVAVRFGSGLFSLPKDQAGLDLLARQGFIAGGLGRHDVNELSRIMADKQVGIDLHTADTSFIMTGTTTRKDLPDQLRLMAAYLTDPGFRPDALVRFRQGMEDTYRALDASPAGQMAGPVALLIHDGDPRFGVPPEQETAQRNLDELRAWMEPGMKSGPLQVVLVGDIEPDLVTDLVATTFAALPARGEGQTVPPPQIRLPSRSQPVEFFHHGPRDQAMSVVFWPTTDSTDHRRDRGLDVLSDILSDRLLHAVREGEGASYSPQAANASSATLPGYGYLAASLDLDSEDAARVNAETVALAASLAAEGVTADELQRALQPRLAEADAVRQSNRWWAYGVLLGMHQLPQRLEAARTAKVDLEAQTVESIDALARQFLAPEHALRVLILPAPAE